MSYRLLAILFIFLSCASEIKVPKILSLPPTKKNSPDLVEKTIFSMGLMTEYEVWDFLRGNPNEAAVLDNIGLPDSVWRSENDSTKFLYYFVDKIQDYNIIEINSFSNKVSGFEWD